MQTLIVTEWKADRITRKNMKNLIFVLQTLHAQSREYEQE